MSAEMGSGTIAGTALRVLCTTLPDPISVPNEVVVGPSSFKVYTSPLKWGHRLGDTLNNFTKAFVGIANHASSKTKGRSECYKQKR